MKSDLARDLLNKLPDAILTTSAEGTIIFWSAGAEAVFGYTSDEAVGRSLGELVVPYQQTGELQKALHDAIDYGASTSEAIRRKKDGSLIYVDISSTAVRDASGQVAFVLISNRDVTDLKLERDAALATARFGDLLESVPDGIVMTNPTGRIVLINTQAAQLFGYEEGELRGKPVEMLMPERYRRSHVGHRSNYFAQPRTRAMGIGLELYGLRKDRSEFPIDISLSPLKTDEGTLVMSAIRDMTERKRFDGALQQKNTQLAQANQAKDNFLAGMSHELRTPLNAIIGFTGTLLMKLPGPINSDQEKQLRTVQSSARHLLALINDLLDVAKIEAGKTEIQVEAVVVQRVIEEVVAALHPEAQHKGIAFECSVPESDLIIRTDRRALHQIVLNLANNALKFTDRGGVYITAGRSAPAQSSALKISVEDTGIGIREEDQSGLFKAYTRMDVSKTKSREGTGLGLYLSQKLAHLLGGTITCQSEHGKGSTFTLTLMEL